MTRQIHHKQKENSMNHTHKISYLQNKTWNEEISRTEALFCAELFFLLKEKDNLLKFIKNFQIKQGNYDVGYEVSFYRDILKVKEFADKIKGKYSLHRTFDLTLFSENDIYIIEAKAHDGFNNEQLDNFIKDKKDILKILEEINSKTKIEIHLLALISSNYRLKIETKNKFDSIITWKEVYELFGNEMFNRADEIYSK